MQFLLIFAFIFTINCAVFAFKPLRSKPAVVIGTSSSHRLGAITTTDVSIFEGIRAPVESYVNIWTTLFEPYRNILPETLLHWGHGGAMLTVLIAMGGIGTFLGWEIRNGKGNGKFWFTLGETARSRHPKIMLLATFFFLLGGQGGLVLLAFQGKDILNSPHAVTAVAGLTLLAAQAALPLLFEKTPAARSAHAYLGSATMALLFVHAFSGINLGLSF